MSTSTTKHSLAALLVAGAATIWATPALPTPSMFPIERYYQYPVLNGRSPTGPALSPDGKKIVFGWNQTGERKLDVWMMDYPSGQMKRIVEASKIDDLPRQDDTRTQQEKDEQTLYDGGISSFTWAPDSKEFLFTYKGRTFRMDRDGKSFEPIVDGNSGSFGYDFTPDGKYMLYFANNNLFRMNRDGSHAKQLTFISKPNTSLAGFTVSPDGKRIAVDWQDSSKLGSHVMMDFSKDRATVVNIRRMWEGEKSNDSQIGVLNIDGGLIKFLPDIPHNFWSKGMEWSPDSKTLALSWINDSSQEFTLTTYDAVADKKSDIYHEKAPSEFINDWRPITWARDSKGVLLGTDLIDGKWAYRSIVKVNPDTKAVSTVYSGGHDVGAMIRPKDSDRLVLVVAAPTPLTTEIVIVEPNGKTTTHDVMPGGYASIKQFNWADSPLVSDDGKSIVTVASGRKISNELYAVEPKMERLTKSQLPDFAKVKWADFKEVTFQSPDGKTIHGLLITRPGLDMTKKHPAFLSNIYADSAKANWGGYLENYAAMELDMVVLCVDFRSSWGYGGEMNAGYYRSLGIVDVDEAVGAKNYLASLSFVNPNRVGIWGWSYGGYLTLMTLLTKPGVFDTGVAVASVTEWKSYNEWYTRRRLGLVQDDPEIYKKTSPITYASGLKDNLLMVHGMLDDNVLFQDDVRMVQKLIDNGKYFDVMYYPRDDHSISKDTSRPHVFANIMRYLWEKLSRD